MEFYQNRGTLATWAGRRSSVRWGGALRHHLKSHDHEEVVFSDHEDYTDVSIIPGSVPGNRVWRLTMTSWGSEI